ncbi:hypothetical protein DPMN_049932 [Dreissena polymorpha]|uniref:Uncharacterized protein n=1 Tax=Dreissena polymorpha TaxID=45954 RepID=A0A9D4HKV5_DREPO|nr:hypothetical protein DPMN_049932 [Dreissena polymorpha]
MASYWSKRRKIVSSVNLQVDAISNIYTETNQINNDAELVDSTVPSYSKEYPDLQIPLFVDNEESDALDLASDSENSASSVADHDTLNIFIKMEFMMSPNMKHLTILIQFLMKMVLI